MAIPQTNMCERGQYTRQADGRSAPHRLAAQCICVHRTTNKFLNVLGRTHVQFLQAHRERTSARLSRIVWRECSQADLCINQLPVCSEAQEEASKGCLMGEVLLCVRIWECDRLAQEAET